MNTPSSTLGRPERTLKSPRRLARPKVLGRRKSLTTAVRYLVLVLVGLMMIGPILWPLLISLKDPTEQVYGAGASLVPQHWSLDNYAILFKEIPLVKYIGNSLSYALLAVLSNVLLATAAGYMLSRQSWRGRSVVALLVISAMIFPFESIMLSLYTQVQNLGLLDNVLGVWLPGIVGVFNVLVMRTAFADVPKALEEAAFIDGAGEFRRFWSIFLPQAKGSVIIVALTSFIGAWDDFLWPKIVLNSQENQTLTQGLASLQGNFGFDVRVLLAGAAVALIPVVVIFFGAQRYFFKGVEEGGVKF